MARIWRESGDQVIWSGVIGRLVTNLLSRLIAPKGDSDKSTVKSLDWRKSVWR